MLDFSSEEEEDVELLGEDAPGPSSSGWMAGPRGRRPSSWDTIPAAPAGSAALPVPPPLPGADEQAARGGGGGGGGTQRLRPRQLTAEERQLVGSAWLVCAGSAAAQAEDAVYELQVNGVALEDAQVGACARGRARAASCCRPGPSRRRRVQRPNGC